MSIQRLLSVILSAACVFATSCAQEETLKTKIFSENVSSVQQPEVPNSENSGLGTPLPYTLLDDVICGTLAFASQPGFVYELKIYNESPIQLNGTDAVLAKLAEFIDAKSHPAATCILKSELHSEPNQSYRSALITKFYGIFPPHSGFSISN